MPYLLRLGKVRQKNTKWAGNTQSYTKIHIRKYAILYFPYFMFFFGVLLVNEFDSLFSAVCFFALQWLHYSTAINCGLSYLHCIEILIFLIITAVILIPLWYSSFWFHLNRVIGHLLDIFVPKILISAPNQVLSGCTGTTKIFSSLNHVLLTMLIPLHKISLLKVKTLLKMLTSSVISWRH